jgi:ribonuclease P protein component
LSCPGAEGRDASASRSDARRASRSFPRTSRLTARREFAAVYEKGRRTGSASLILFGLPNSVGHCRLGITVTRKVGGAVERNRIKRVFRDIFRRHRTTLEPGLDLVVNAKKGTDRVPTADLEREFLASFGEIARRFRS